MQYIENCYLQCAHTQAQEIAPVQISPTVSNSRDIFKCQWPKHVSQSHTEKLLPDFMKHNAYVPTYGNFSLSAEQLTSDIASFEHITEAFNNYNFYYYLFLNSRMLIVTWADNKSLFLQLYQIHNMVLTPHYQLQNYPILTVICCRYIIFIHPQPS